MNAGEREQLQAYVDEYWELMVSMRNAPTKKISRKEKVATARMVEIFDRVMAIMPHSNPMSVMVEYRNG